MSTPKTFFDNDAVRAARDGDTQKRSFIMTCLADSVRAMVVVRLAPSAMRAQDVDDLVQDALTAISEGITTLREPTVATLRSFASTIVSRSVAKYLSRDPQRNNRKPVSLDAETGDGSSAGALRNLLSASGISPGAIASRREQVHGLLMHLAALKASHRDVITMSIIDQLPMNEVAERLGLKRPAASMLLYRAMRILRRNITGSSQLGDEDATHS
jgi:RNA polymerase sigma factor (sigma-70 family)